MGNVVLRKSHRHEGFFIPIKGTGDESCCLAAQSEAKESDTNRATGGDGGQQSSKQSSPSCSY